MTTRFHDFAVATLIAGAPIAGWAQTKPASPATQAASAPGTPLATVRPASGYTSAFDGYRAFSEQKVLSWRESNDLVGRIGGWQSYAREAAGGEAMPANQTGAPAAGTPGSSPAPVQVPPPAKPASAPSNSSNDPHAGHVMPKKP